jgi:hypothetical protein
MTPRHRPGQTAPRATEVVHTGTPRTEWCTACKAWTQLAGDTLLLAADGVTTLSTWSGCQICTQEDPRG